MGLVYATLAMNNKSNHIKVTVAMPTKLLVVTSLDNVQLYFTSCANIALKFNEFFETTFVAFSINTCNLCSN